MHGTMNIVRRRRLVCDASIFLVLASHLDALDGVLGLAAGQCGVELFEEGGRSGHDAVCREAAERKKERKKNKEKRGEGAKARDPSVVWRPLRLFGSSKAHRR